MDFVCVGLSGSEGWMLHMWQVEAELNELDPEERLAYLEELGVDQARVPHSSTPLPHPHPPGARLTAFRCPSPAVTVYL